MLFNSPEFVFLFLPISLIGYYALIWLKLHRWMFVYLIAVSTVFYSVWNPPYTLLLFASMLFNYLFGVWIERRKLAGRSAGWPLALGVMGNLLTLGYYKYAGFFIENLNYLSGSDFVFEKIILPLGISFYTFGQIAYLVDMTRGAVTSGGIARYATFVIFFPHLLAGPIIHYREVMPQFFGRSFGRFWQANLVIGLAIFAIGLFKKTVLADTSASFATPVFDAVHAQQAITFYDGWRAAICYKIQLYFDFSGYSDMAVGLARMFGILLTANFYSPLRAFSIIDYWRRWHMTLQQFIVSYMYQPLALPLARLSARLGISKWPDFGLTVALPTFIVFLASGLWHGAAWTFVIWGAMHGVFLAVNEFWRALRRKSRRTNPPQKLDNAIYFTLTLACAVLASTMFRAEAPRDAFVIWGAMLNFREASGILSIFPANLTEFVTEPLVFVAIAAAIIFLFPNTQQILGRYRPVLYWDKWKNVSPSVVKLRWRPTVAWAVATGVVLFAGVAFIFRAQSEFIYFNF